MVEESAVKEFSIWMGGYRDNGNSAPAHLVGTGLGATFKEAVLEFSKRQPHRIHKKDAARMSVYGCSLYDNEIDARKGYG